MSVEGLFGIFCTVAVDRETIKSWLHDAYSTQSSTIWSLYVVNNETPPGPGTPPTSPDFSGPLEFPFEGYDILRLAEWVRTQTSRSALSGGSFLVVDDQSVATNSFVYVSLNSPSTFSIVRLGTKVANSVPVSVQLGNLSVGELEGMLDGDGVFRG